MPPEIVEAMGAPPTPDQWRAISMPLEPYVVVAGAGSGKTSVIAARVVYLALVATGRLEAGHPGVLPGNVLCLTFTNKATEHLTLKIRRALSALDLAEGEEPTVLNYHGFAAQVLDRHGLMARIESGQRVLTEAQRTELCGRVLDEMTFEHVSAQWQPSVITKILALADQAANHRRDPEEIVEFCRNRLEALSQHRSERPYVSSLERIELARAVQRFQELKRDLGVIDFGDQIALALKVVEGFPGVTRDYRSRYSAVVLDEYQDTNVAQADLIASVFGEGFPVAAVGDPDQNIYAWRGASLYNLLQFPERFLTPAGAAAAQLPLNTNFRSGARILQAANRVIEPVHHAMAALPEKYRPRVDKRLEPWAANGEGRVEIVRFSDEWTEACWIADRILDLHGDESKARPWGSFAVLARSSRLFVPLQEAFAERKIPAEIVGLAGLLRLPEVVEVLAYARSAADPFASVSLARILLGPRYRVGFKDLARVAAWAKDKNYVRRGEEEEEEEALPFLFAEALDHLDEVTFLSEEGRGRLEEFRAELAELRSEARRPVGEFLAEIIRRIGLTTELDASPNQEPAVATRRNLAAFLDQVHAFSPLEGELTLRAFLDYVDTVEEAGREEWSPVQPSTQNSVKVMTIHQAKGLEFEVVFVPGLAQDILPNLKVQQNPAERGYSLDFELRGDHEILPTFHGNLRQFWQALRDQEELEERRTCYVALTRARERLIVTGAHWYGDGTYAKNPSVFFDELADWGEGTGLAGVDRGPKISEQNPLLGYRERFVRDWPGPALRDEGDGLFPDGWRRAAAVAEGDRSSLEEAVARMNEEEQGVFREASAENRSFAAHLVEREREGPRSPALPKSISVAGVIEYARCPKRFYWSAVRPLPRFSGPAARIGTQVHAWIERRGSGQASLIELDETPDLTAEELAGEPGKIERLQQHFLESRFAGGVPLYAERPFLLYLEGFVVGGRIDAIFGTPEGAWEVVDYKTGRKPPQDDPVSALQLDVYSLACTEVFGKRPEEITLTYFYLSTGEEWTRPAGDPELTRSRVIESLRGIAGRRFEPVPGDHCRWCDFLSFCEPGRKHVAAVSPETG